MSRGIVNARQIRAGRHLAGLSQADIVAATGLSMPTVKRAESDRDVSVSTDALSAICIALEAAGVIFVEENGEGPGVRLRSDLTIDAVLDAIRAVGDGKGIEGKIFLEHGRERTVGRVLGYGSEHISHSSFDAMGWEAVLNAFHRLGAKAPARSTSTVSAICQHLLSELTGKGETGSPMHAGPATDVVKLMDAAIVDDKRKKR